MARTADLLTVLHDIDAYRGKVCATCNHYVNSRHQLPHQVTPPCECKRGHKPAGPDDTCDDHSRRSTRILK